MVLQAVQLWKIFEQIFWGWLPCTNRCKNKENKHTKRNDAFLRGSDPLPAVIKLWHQKGHTHSTESAEALRRLSALPETKQAFLNYFNYGKSPAEAMRLHESKLLVKEGRLTLLANSAVNPLPPMVYYWHKGWRKNHFGSNVDPLQKIAENLPLYKEQDECIVQNTVDIEA